MPVKKIKVSELPEVGNIDDFEVLGVNARDNSSAKATMSQLREGANQAQSDWEQADTTARDYIKNKPNAEVVENKRPISSDAGPYEYPTSQSVFSLITDIAATIPAGGLKTPISIDTESQLPDVSTLAVGDYFFIQNMDQSAPNRTGRAWVNHIDHDPAKPLTYYKVFDQYQSMDGVSITQTGNGAWEVNLAWLDARITVLANSLISAIPVATPSANGLMSSEDRLRYPARMAKFQAAFFSGIIGGKKLRINFTDNGNTISYQIRATGMWNFFNAGGIIEKVGYANVGSSGNRTVLAMGNTAGSIYIGDATSSYIDIVYRNADPASYVAAIFSLEVHSIGSVTFTVETLDSTPEERAMSNADEI